MKIINNLAKHEISSEFLSEYNIDSVNIEDYDTLGSRIYYELTKNRSKYESSSFYLNFKLNMRSHNSPISGNNLNLMPFLQLSFNDLHHNTIEMYIHIGSDEYFYIHLMKTIYSNTFRDIINCQFNGFKIDQHSDLLEFVKWYYFFHKDVNFRIEYLSNCKTFKVSDNYNYGINNVNTAFVAELPYGKGGNSFYIDEIENTYQFGESGIMKPFIVSKEQYDNILSNMKKE